MAYRRGLARTLLTYAGLVGLPLVVGFAVALSMTDPQDVASEVPAPAGDVPSPGHLLFAITFVCMATVTGGWLARFVRQPQAVGQMIVGFAIGPSLLGRLVPGFESWLFPPGTVAILALFGGIGAIFFIFLVGLDMSVSDLRRIGRATALIGLSSMAVPFMLGTVLAAGLIKTWPGLDTLAPGATALTLFIGVSMSITALPVLAHILRERGLDQQPIGVLGISSSALCDAVAWCLLAITLAVASSGSVQGAVLAALAVVLFALVMWFLARPALHRFGNSGRAGPVTPLLALLGMLVAALATESLGAHAFFGAFLAGLIVPRSGNYRMINSKLEGLVEWFLLPMFFVSIGLNIKLDLLDSARDLLVLAVVLAVALGGKVAATAVAARLSDLGRHNTARLAAMMNCRGITDLVVLNVGLQAGILDQKLFTILTIVSITNTLITGPALDVISSWRARFLAGHGSPPEAAHPRAGPGPRPNGTAR